ncbi:hypothetical protein HDF16_005163 [Granulicella aggregans]|uniref:Uncharacterized protein n=1 Tax=Granulicella aggregans TaxID=474949 RepID=A0A7W7ZIB5_9BACT|nr:hypothetical protein [Granulicella aggregans]MBB5060427.1 hypothetical protein [Granulicella aggregans]
MFAAHLAAGLAISEDEHRPPMSLLLADVFFPDLIDRTPTAGVEHPHPRSFSAAGHTHLFQYSWRPRCSRFYVDGELEIYFCYWRFCQLLISVWLLAVFLYDEGHSRMLSWRAWTVACIVPG